MSNRTRKWWIGVSVWIVGLSPTLMGIQSCQNKKVDAAASTGAGFCGRIPSAEIPSLLGNWKIPPYSPIPTAIARPSSGGGQMTVSDFSTLQLTAILDAFDSWNQFFRTQVPNMSGRPLFDYGSRGSVRTAQAVPLPPGVCPSSIVSGNTFTGTVNLYNVSANWPTSLGSGVIALTTYCTSDEGYYRRSITGAQIAYNTQDYGDPGGTKPAPDWGTIARHETGHLMGQDHVSNTNSLMQPNLMGGGIAKILPIDAGTQNRAGCLYGE